MNTPSRGNLATVLIDAAEILKWLNESGSVSIKDLEPARLSEIRQLENLGLISRSASGRLRLQRIRIRRLVSNVILYEPKNRCLLQVSPYDQIAASQWAPQ